VAQPVFYYDVSSPYAWMAAERIGDLIPDADWRPLYAPALLKLNGRTMWVLTDERESRLAEIEQRAAGYGLPPIRWPASLARRGIDLARAATVARHEGREAEFSLTASRAIFTEGADPSEPEEIRRIANEVGLDGDALLERIATQEVKDEVRATIDEAYARGVQGIPAVIVGDELFWGDDRLEDAAAAWRRACG
jgi:2-hydroxychromene-2-carboxylate isomerase